MNISKFNNFINEAKYYIFEKPFRIDDLQVTNFYKQSDLKKWANGTSTRPHFDKWAIALFVSKDQIKSESETPFQRKEDRNVKTSDISLDYDENEVIDEDEISLKELLDKMPTKIELRLSSRGTKNKVYFDDNTSGNSGYLIEESKFEYMGNEFYLFVFKKGMNDDNRARQLHGFVYEKEVKIKYKLKETTKGEKWDAVGSINLDHLKEKIELDKVSIVKNGKSTPVTDIKQIENNFDVGSEFNWSIKSCSLGSSGLYFADFKRISGLVLEGDKLKLKKSELQKYILVIGLHDKGEFKKEYIISIDVDKWLSYLPKIKNEEIFKKLNQMYIDLRDFKNSDKTEKDWLEYRKKYGEISKDSLISLNFKRDSKGQLRIQSSMSMKGFKDRLLKENDHILIEKSS